MRKIIKILISFILITFIFTFSMVNAFTSQSTPLYNGIDVSNWQQDVDYKRVKESGIEIVYMKASQGQRSKDKSFEKHYKEAKEKLLLARFQAVTQQESPSYKGTSFEETFGVIAEEWFAEGRVSLKPSTISRYRSILDTYLIPEFGTVKIEGISRADVNTFYTRLLSESGCHKKPLSPKTVLCILSVFRIVLKYARLEKGLNVVNTEDISIKQEQKVLRVFSMDEYRIISNKLISSHSMDCLGILLSLYTGVSAGRFEPFWARLIQPIPDNLK